MDVSEFSRDFEYGVEKEYMMRIYTPSNESLFPTLYENIINKQGGFETNSRAEMIIVGMKMFSGEVKKIANLDPNIALTPRCGFPDIILPGDVRNSIYVTLNAGDFLQGRKTTGKNLEISVQLRDGYGIPIQNSLFIGTGEKPSSTFDSIVYYHSNSSKWLETIRVDIPFAQFDRGTHLFFYFRHCSTTDKASDKTERSFAFSVVPLMNSDDTAIGIFII